MIFIQISKFVQPIFIPASYFQVFIGKMKMEARRKFEEKEKGRGGRGRGGERLHSIILNIINYIKLKYCHVKVFCRCI